MAISPVPAPGWRPLINGVQTLPINSNWHQFVYAGVNFGPFTTVEDYQVTAVYDERMNKSFNQFTLTCFSTITSTSSIGSDVLAQAVRRALMTQGGLLLLKGRAVGVMQVNDGRVTDVKNGPIPTVLTPTVWGQLTSGFRWTLSWCLPDCGDAVYTAQLGTLSNTYTVSTQVDRGYSTRTISGRAVIPQNRAALGARFPADAATKFLEIADGRPGSLFPIQPPGFTRGPYSTTLSEDRATLTYSVTDTQMGPTAPPPGVLPDPEESFDLHTETSAGLCMWTASLAGRYEVPYGGDINAAINAFMEFVAGKLTFMLKMLGEQKDFFGFPRKGRPNGLVPRSWAMGNPNSRGRRFATFAFTFTFATGLKNCVEQSGLWSPVSNGSWQAWFDTMGAVFTPLGSAKLDFKPNEDYIVDLCEPNTRDLGNTAPGRGVLPRNGVPPADPKVTVQELKAQFAPQPGNNWLYYRAWLQPADDDGVNGVRTLPTKPLAGVTDLVGTVNAMNLSAVEGAIAGGVSTLIGGALLGTLTPPPVSPGGGAGNASGVPGIPTNGTVGVLTNQDVGTTWVERGRRPQRYVWFCGQAARYGSAVPEPFLTFVIIKGQKVPVIRCQRGEESFWQNTWMTPAFAGGDPYPVYVSHWRVRYGIVGPVPVGPVELPPNPGTGN